MTNVARTLLLAAMLAVALGCDPGAAEPTAFAPDDLARVLPDRIGDVPLEVVSATRDDPVVAAYHRKELVPVSILLALIGYALGNYIAYAAAVLCKMVS